MLYYCLVIMMTRLIYFNMCLNAGVFCMPIRILVVLINVLFVISTYHDKISVSAYSYLLAYHYFYFLK